MVSVTIERLMKYPSPSFSEGIKQICQCLNRFFVVLLHLLVFWTSLIAFNYKIPCDPSVSSSEDRGRKDKNAALPRSTHCFDD